MPTYRVRFVVKTAIRAKEEILLDHKGHRVVLLLTPKETPGDTGNVVVDVDGANYQDAQRRASGEIVPPVLDALAFSTGIPLLLLHWDYIRKNETTSDRRRAIYCEFEERTTPLGITEEAVFEAQKILSHENGPALPLCWHRYALQRNLILDRFLFQWLAFGSGWQETNPHRVPALPSRNHPLRLTP
jgi:hypothetical protein